MKLRVYIIKKYIESLLQADRVLKAIHVNWWKGTTWHTTHLIAAILVMIVREKESMIFSFLQAIETDNNS
jgi:hypothetical protein